MSESERQELEQMLELVKRRIDDLKRREAELELELEQAEREKAEFEETIRRALGPRED